MVDERFDVVGGVLQLRPGVALDYEAGSVITVDVTVLGSGFGFTQRFDVAVSDVNEVATAVRLSSAAVRENAAGATIGQLTVTDPDAGDRHGFAVSDPRFEVVNGALKLKAGVALDHEAGAVVPVEVTATDAAGLSLRQRFTLNVQDVDEVVNPPVKEEAGGKRQHVQGTNGNDILIGSGGSETLSGGNGHDRLTGGAGHDRLLGGNGNDQLYGGGGKDMLDGGAGNDKVLGGGGADTFIFDLGNDKLVGGKGRDMVKFDGAFEDYGVTFGKKVIVTFEDDRDLLIGMERLEFGDDTTFVRQGSEWVEL